MSKGSDYCLQVSKGVAPSNWEKLRRSLGGSFYLSKAYADILASQGKVPLFFQYTNRSGKCFGIAAGFLSSLWQRFPLNVLFRSLDLRTHPIVINGSKDILNDFSNRIVQFGKKLHMATVNFGSEDAPISPTILDKLGMIAQHRIEFLVELNKTDDKLINIMHHMRKRYLRKLIKKEILTVFEDNTENGIRKLVSLQGSSRDRRRERGEDYQIATVKNISFIVDQYLNPGYGRLFFASLNDEIVAGIFLHCDSISAYYTRAGSSPEGFQVGASQFLIWEVMRRLRDQEYRTLNLGGVPADSTSKDHPAHGLYFFKSSFGSKEVRCTTWNLETVGIQSKLTKWLSRKL